jgi:hypothetical protein
MTIDLEGVRAVLESCLADQLTASVKATVQSEKQRGTLQEVTFDLWIERYGSKFNQQLFMVLQMDAWDQTLFESSVRQIAEASIRKPFVRRIAHDFKKQAGSN